MAAIVTESEKQSLAAAKKEIDTTIDNQATYMQLRYLARVFTAKAIDRHRDAFLRGFDFLSSSQYANGGFPQFFPLRDGYYSHITFNDDAMIGALRLLRDVADGSSDFSFVDQQRRERAAVAVQKGIDCVLKTQIITAGKKTIWAAQYDE